jgi:hypothetical protein
VNASGLAARSALHTGLDPLHLVEDPARLIEQQRTGLGEFHAARQAMKQGRAQLTLELADLQAKRRLLIPGRSAARVKCSSSATATK